MKPLYLERALAGEPVFFKDKNGEYHKGKLVFVSPKIDDGSYFRYLVVYGDSDKQDESWWFSETQLFMESIKCTVWINLYKHLPEENIITMNGTYATKEKAEKGYADMLGEYHIYLGAFPIEIEE